MQRIRQNALIRRDLTVLKGEWRPGKRQARLVEEAATGLERRGRRSGANREAVAERRVERVVEAAGWKRSGKAGNVDPGMESARAGFVAGERKAVASIRSRSEERPRRASRRLIRRLAKPAVG